MPEKFNYYFNVLVIFDFESGGTFEDRCPVLEHSVRVFCDRIFYG